MLELGELTQIATRDRVAVSTVERDYILTHILCELARHPGRDLFQFKGGTSLRLCYFSDYRYSADIDLNINPDAEVGDGDRLLKGVLSNVENSLGLPKIELVLEGRRHVAYVGPTRTGRSRRIKLDIASDEYIADPTSVAQILPRFPDVHLVERRVKRRLRQSGYL